MTANIYPHASAKCGGKCYGGRRCSCDGNTAHEQHVCSDEHCACHTPAAWGLERAVVNGREVYRTAEALPANVTVLEVRL